ncbi:MAG: FAD assembly factor SdhE [Sphingosinicella sp.]
MDRASRLKRLRYRACHRGIREADLLLGTFFDREHRHWGEAEIAWFEALLNEQDVDILAWATGSASPPQPLAGPAMNSLQTFKDVSKAFG